MPELKNDQIPNSPRYPSRNSTFAAIVALGISVIGCSSGKPPASPATATAPNASATGIDDMDELASLAGETDDMDELASLAGETDDMDELASLAGETQTENPPPPPPQPGGLILSDSRPYFKPGEHSLKSLPMPSGTAAERGEGQSYEPEGPTAGPSYTEASAGTVANAERVVESMRGRFRGCYQAGLRTNPYMGGSVTITATIEPTGKVKSITEAGDGGLRPIIPCLRAVVSSGNFAPPTPKGSEAAISIPIKFVRQ